MNWHGPSTALPAPAWQPRRGERQVNLEEHTRTLDQYLAEGRLPVPEALRLATSLADSLRKMHDEGRVHGALTPACIQLTGSDVNLLPPRTPHGLVTPYTAPEVLRGRKAEVPSDIFSFGAIGYEMLTGRWPFEADTPEALAAALMNSPVPGTGNPALDVLVSNCLAKDPAARWQRMQKAQMELRLLTVSARRTEGPPRRDHVAGLIRSEVQAVENRLGSRLEAQEKVVAELQQAVAASLRAVQTHLCTIDAKLASVQEQAARVEAGASECGLRISGLEQRLSAPTERLAKTELLLQTATERVARAETVVETIHRHSTEFADDASVRLHALEQTIASQADALESARRALAQTDDLVERVVEALDSLQSIVLERSEEKSSAIN